jgi:hypothetical protein
VEDCVELCHAERAICATLARRWLVMAVLVAAAACGGAQGEHVTAEPVSGGPGERSSPAPSDTPISVLLEQGGQLRLSADQVAKLKTIDQRLAARNDQIDAELRFLDPPVRMDPGVSNDGMTASHPSQGGARTGGAPIGAGIEAGIEASRDASSESSTNVHRDPSDRYRLLNERASNVRDAIDRALVLLNPEQQDLARKLLDEQ